MYKFLIQVNAELYVLQEADNAVEAFEECRRNIAILNPAYVVRSMVTKAKFSSHDDAFQLGTTP